MNAFTTVVAVFLVAFAFVVLIPLSSAASKLQDSPRNLKEQSRPWRPQHAFPSFRPQCPGDTEPLILTPYLASGKIQEAQQLATVKLWRSNVTSYSGYFTVNATDDSNMFFWFFPAEIEHPEEAPVVLW